MRKVPDNVPHHEMMAANLGKPLSRIPDPFNAGFQSFAHHNNAMLRDFLDRFGFDYEFVAACDRYNCGDFDAALARVLEKFGAIMDIMLPTLRAERAATYSPVLPISAKSGKVLQVPVEVVDADAGMIRFDDEGETVEQCIFGGQAKLQWKVDWAMRWYALGVDYEMCGKDLTDSVTQSGRIVRVLGGRMPENMIYELFLDENGEKISKSKGNGLTIEEWLRYGSEESLGLYLFREPKSAKSLHAGVVPRAVDEYWQFRSKIPEQPLEQQLGNPVWHLLRANGYEGGDGDSLPVTYGLLLNLASVLGTEATPESLAEYLGNYIARADRRSRDLDQADRHRASTTTAISSPRRCTSARRRTTRRRRCGRSTPISPVSRQAPPPRTCRPRSTRSARTRRSASRACGTGSRRFTRRCSEAHKDRAWAASSRFTGSTIPAS